MNGIAIISLTLLGALTASSAPFSDTQNTFDRDAFFRRTMAHTTERAQADLMESTVLWEQHTSWDDPWRIRTPSYEVVTTGSRLAGLEVAHGLETMLGHFQDVTGIEHTPARPFPIHVYPDVAGYNGFGSNAGAEHSSFYASFYADGDPAQPVATFKTTNSGLQLMWATHGATHQFLSGASAATVPAWLGEGLASFFALSWGYSAGVAELKQVIGSRDYVPFDQLLTDDIADFTDRPAARLIELGMLFNYLMYFRPDTATVLDQNGYVTSAPFRDYLRAQLQGRNTAGSHVNTLLSSGRSGLERDFRTFDGWE